nr:MAG TPA: PL-2 Papain fold toxin 2 [Caudoviricetes sp.]
MTASTHLVVYQNISPRGSEREPWSRRFES